MITENSEERVRKSSPDKLNNKIDTQLVQNVREYEGKAPEDITLRIDELEKEWDIERAIELNASILALSGILLGTFVNKKWFLLPGVVTAFLLQHAVQGWCPPVPILRKLNYRTRAEIDKEKNALKALRGDYNKIKGRGEQGIQVKTEKVIYAINK